jgi:hypothetical protein
MTYSSKGLSRIFFLALALVISGSLVQSHAQKRRKHKPKPMVALEDLEEPPPSFVGVRLKMADGSFMPVDDAWETEAGYWFKKGGMTQFLTRDRVKGIERNAAKPKVEEQVAVIKDTAPTKTPSEDLPAWIYLKGGAKFEADSVTESAAGAWYRRGPMAIFIERSRIERIEREDPETLAKSDSNSRELRWSTGSARIDGLIRQNGAKYGVDPYLIFCVMEQESHFSTRAVSPKGARGLMQLMPGTAARFGVRNSHDPAQNISGGTRYLKLLLNQFGGRVDLVLASYNAGEGAVIKYGHRVPPYKETRDYVRRIGYRYRKAKAPVKLAANHTTANGH